LETLADVTPVLYWPPKATAGVPWRAIVDPLELGVVDEFNGGSHQQREQRESTVLRGAPPSTAFLRQGSFEVPKYPGERFSVETIDRSGSLTHVRVFRLAPENSQRRGVERGK
jgi:hypothetical protein